MTLTLDVPLVVASDVHLRRPDDERARLLLDVFARLGPNVEYLVLNGDIFDFCFGDSRYFKDKFRGFGEALQVVAGRGVRVLFVEGNHEFHLDRIGWSGVEIVTALDTSVRLKSGERIKFTHGDLLTQDPLYRAFRGLVKSTLARRVASLLPGRWLDAYAMKHATVSRAQDKYRKLDHARILGAFNRWAATGDCDHGIIGHFHVPYAEKHETQAGLMLSVESWDRPNLLVYDGQKFRRIYLTTPGAAFALEPAVSLFRSKSGTPD